MKHQQNPSDAPHPTRAPWPSSDPHSSVHRQRPADQPSADGSHRRHRWMMLACCVPMLGIVAVLLATGKAGGGAVIFALACVGIMTVMMLAMPRGHDH